MPPSTSLRGRFRALPSIRIRPRFRRPIAPSIYRCSYATQNSLPRKSITVTSDDGRIRWSELSTREKAARTAQQSFNFVVIITGVVMTGAIAWFLYLDVFSSNSKTSHFNRAVKRIKRDSRCIELLGEKESIKAYGEPTWNKLSRNRPIASRSETDKMGTEHLYMQFNVEGPLNSGRVVLHMTKKPSESDFEYRYLYVDIKGQQRIWLENADANKRDRPSGKILGIRFR